MANALGDALGPPQGSLRRGRVGRGWSLGRRRRGAAGPGGDALRPPHARIRHGPRARGAARRSVVVGEGERKKRVGTTAGAARRRRVGERRGGPRLPV